MVCVNYEVTEYNNLRDSSQFVYFANQFNRQFGPIYPRSLVWTLGMTYRTKVRENCNYSFAAICIRDRREFWRFLILIQCGKYFVKYFRLSNIFVSLNKHVNN